MKMNFKKFFSVIIFLIIILTVFIPNVFAAENEISEVNLVIPVPKVGEEISSYADVDIDNDNDKCCITSIIWFSEKMGLETIAQSDVFFAGIQLFGYYYTG